MVDGVDFPVRNYFVGPLNKAGSNLQSIFPICFKHLWQNTFCFWKFSFFFPLSYPSFRYTMEAVPANCLGDIRPLALEACVIGIDEGQFVSIYIVYIFLFFALN